MIHLSPPPHPSVTIEAPNKKVTVGALAGAIVMLLTWALHSFTEVQLSAEAAVALTTIITFGVSYMVAEPNDEPAYPRTFEERRIGDLSVLELRTLLGSEVGRDISDG